MVEKPKSEVTPQVLATEIRKMVHGNIGNPQAWPGFQTALVAQKFLKKVETDLPLTRDVDPISHFCVYFPAYDPKEDEVFIGRHRKSGLLLFNGGHIDPGELVGEAVVREMDEEWGLMMKIPQEPSFFTVTTIQNENQTCEEHYDIWFFIPVDKNDFNPDPEKLSVEFSDIGWVKTKEAFTHTEDLSTQAALVRIRQRIIS